MKVNIQETFYIFMGLEDFVGCVVMQWYLQTVSVSKGTSETVHNVMHDHCALYYYTKHYMCI